MNGLFLLQSSIDTGMAFAEVFRVQFLILTIYSKSLGSWESRVTIYSRAPVCIMVGMVDPGIQLV